MKLRITETKDRRGRSLAVDGELVGAGVLELQRAASRRPPPVTLQLAGLTRLGHAGASLIRRLEREGVGLEGLRPFFEMLIGRRSSGSVSARGT